MPGVESFRFRVTPPPTARDSGPHRIACIALYRTLIKLASRLILPSDLPARRVNPITHLVRKGFKRHAACSGNRAVVRALGVGYHAEQLLRIAAGGNEPATAQIHRMLRLMEEKRAVSAAQPQPVRKARPRVWPHPGAQKLLDVRPRPKEQLGGSGRRGVPVLSSTTGLAFLRTRKPQSPFLSRVLRDKFNQKQRRVNWEIELTDQKLAGKWEEEWDSKVAADMGTTRVRDTWNTWGTAASQAIVELGEHKQATVERVVDFGRKIVEVRDAEKTLWRAERRQRRDEKDVKRRERQNRERRGYSTIASTTVSDDRSSGVVSQATPAEN